MIALVAVVFFTTAGRAGAQQWSQFRGPGGSGVADDQKPQDIAHPCSPSGIEPRRGHPAAKTANPDLER